MISFEHNDTYSDFATWSDKSSPCVICGKPCTDPKYMIHEHGGGGVAVTEEEAATLDGAGDMGLQAIGPDCLKKHPELRPYIQVQQVAKKPRKPRKAAKQVDWDIYADLYRQVFGEGVSDREIAQDIKKRKEILG